MSLIQPEKLRLLQGALASKNSRTFFIMTFGCQMNHADSEKIHMLFAQSGMSLVDSWEEADIVIFNTCSVRQKGEDRVFGFVEEIDKFRKKTGKNILIGLTGCMTRKTGLHKKYYDYRGRKNTTQIELLDFDKIQKTNPLKTGQAYKRQNKGFSLFNSDDELFIRSENIDFVVRIEEIGSLLTLLSIMYGEDIGQDDHFQSYLRIKQERTDAASANVIIQTGCDNYCTFCIVPYTRGHEISRPVVDIVGEVVEAVQHHHIKEVTLLGQNVNSYGKETKKALWNVEELKWNMGVGKGETNMASCLLEKGGQGGLDTSLYIPYNPELTQYAREQRNTSSLAENRMWYDVLRYGKLKTYRFLRQKPLLNFIADFYCSELGLVIEVDGDNHEKQLIYDQYRTDELAKYRLTVLRFHNLRVMEDPAGVEKEIINWIQGNPPLIPPLSRGHNGILKTPFRELLEKIDEIPGLDRIRFTSSNPHDMTRDILDAHFDLKSCCHFLHFALQSGDNELLKKMNRKHTYDDFRTQVEYLRSRDPLFGISTDIIVGFPGETEEQFEHTMKAFRECEFDFAYIARYSPRKQTYASRMPGQISSEIKAQRWDRLNTLMYEIVQRRNQMMIGREEVILVSKIDDEGVISGRTRNFKEVFLPKNDAITLGDLIPVKIVDVDRWVLVGEEVI